MTRKNIILFCLAVFAIVLGAFVSVSAQDAAADSMSNEELTTLLLQIMQKLEQSSETAEAPEPTPTPVPTNTPQPELSDDTAELKALLTAIMQKLQQDQEEPGTAQKPEPETPAGTMVPVSTEKETENSIWDNKKLIIEGLPSYMFIQPTRESVPDTTPPGTPGGDPGGNPGGDPGSSTCDGRPGVCADGPFQYLEQCVCDVFGNCYWTCARG